MHIIHEYAQYMEKYGISVVRWYNYIGHNSQKLFFYSFWLGFLLAAIFAYFFISKSSVHMIESCIENINYVKQKFAHFELEYN